MTYNFLFSESGSNCHKLFPVLCIRIRQQLFRIHNTGCYLSQRQQISASDCTAELCIVKKNFAKISSPFCNSGLDMIEFIGSRNNIWDWYLFVMKITFPFVQDCSKSAFPGILTWLRTENPHKFSNGHRYFHNSNVASSPGTLSSKVKDLFNSALPKMSKKITF